MNIDRFKHEHTSILQSIAALRQLTKSGVIDNAVEIAQGVVAMSALIKLHLSVEDRVLYPALQSGPDESLARLGLQYQREMGAISSAYMMFARRWNTPAAVRENEQEFKIDANKVLRKVYERMQRENDDFYPRIEKMVIQN